MKLLFDQNLSYKLCQDIADLFPGSNHVRTLGLADANDRAIWEFSKANGYTIVSQDIDFAEMVALDGPPPKVIWIRAGNQPRASIASLLRRHFELIRMFDMDDAVCLEIYQSQGSLS